MRCTGSSGERELVLAALSPSGHDLTVILPGQRPTVKYWNGAGHLKRGRSPDGQIHRRSNVLLQSSAQVCFVNVDLGTALKR